MLARRLILMLTLVLVTTAAKAGEAGWIPFKVWLPFESLQPSDRSVADKALAGMFGANPSLWPDWLEPRAALIPAANGKSQLLVVREPVHAPCGQYDFIVYGPAAADGSRPQLGNGFCAGAMEVVPVARKALPDLLFGEGRVPPPSDPSGEAEWTRRDQRVRWTGDGWAEIRKD